MDPIAYMIRPHFVRASRNHVSSVRTAKITTG